ncbi:alpha/beta fold hydrolase, partial [Aphanothece microscopica]|uniref:alpha/beta fold hydrolase n=1 Tax=Aphanothece microscopica TaxID=1049561 RepID=UPI0039852D3B
MTQTFTARDGASIAFDDQGSGLPVLCLPGLTRTMGDFGYMIPHLPPCRLIRMDYRGRGASQWTGAATYTVPQEAQDALALLDHLGVEKAAVIG